MTWFVKFLGEASVDLTDFEMKGSLILGHVMAHEMI